MSILGTKVLFLKKGWFVCLLWVTAGLLAHSIPPEFLLSLPRALCSPSVASTKRPLVFNNLAQENET